LRRLGWFLWIPLGLSTPVLALTLEIQAGPTTLTIADNEALDQDPGVGRIRFQGLVGENTSSPLDVDIQLTEKITENGWQLTLTTPQDGITNAGAPLKVNFAVASSPLKLNNPVQFQVQYGGQWGDVSDGRQQINARSTWSLSSDGTPLQQLQLDPVESRGKVVPFSRDTQFEAPRPLQNLTTMLQLTLGEGDALTITELTVNAQSPSTIDPRWFYIAGAIGAFAVLSFLWLRPRRRRRN